MLTLIKIKAIKLKYISYYGNTNFIYNMRFIYQFTFGLLLLIPLLGIAQLDYYNDIQLKWNTKSFEDTTIVNLRQLEFDNSLSDDKSNGLASYYQLVKLKPSQQLSVSIDNIQTLKIENVNNYQEYRKLLDSNFTTTVEYLYERGEKTAIIRLSRFVEKNNNEIHRLQSMKLTINISNTSKIGSSKGRVYASHSVLSQGDWYKIKLSKSGIYKVSGSDLQSMGFSLSGLSVNEVRLYGNGGGMLPEANSIFRYDDLFENAIEIHDLNSNGSFDADDYFLFYGTGPHLWNYNKSREYFTHKKHIYDDYAFYFITIKSGNGKRIINDTNIYGTANVFVSDFTDFSYHENDSLNLIKTGREWYGEQYDVITNYKYKFQFPNIMTNKDVILRTDVIARSTNNSTMLYRANGNEKTFQFAAVNPHYLATYAHSINDTFLFKTNSSTIDVQLFYSKPNSSAQAWLNYIEINAQRHLTMSGQQMGFRTPNAVGLGNSAEYTLENASQSIEIWDISNPLVPIIMSSSITSNTLKFTSSADSLRTFVAHQGGYYTPTKVGSVENQDLHSLSKIDYVILYHPNFKSQAEKLADFHRTHSNLIVYTTDAQKIFNEFSSGAKDLAAIRDFMKMLYDKAAGDVDEIPQYLLLFGDASYDFKNRIANNTNMILTYESGNSLSPTGSYCTDDFFGLLDNTEGAGAYGSLDIGIGRFPITSVDQANSILSKIFRYKLPEENRQVSGGSSSCSNGSSGVAAMADWRNINCFIGDDEEGNIHTAQADYLANYVGSNYPDYNIDKIFFDAYTQVITPGGQRYPDVKTAINQRVDKGALVINYTGHGGEEGWAHESVLEVKDINSWTNYSNLPLFVTATCEFSRYDDPGRISAGEYVLLNPNGGGIALLTTSRVTYSSTNFTLSKIIYQHLFEKQNGEYPSVGDIIRISKNGAGSISPNKNFVLLGDPALKLVYPYDEVITTAIVDDKTGLQIDTIKALQRVTISGEVQHNGQIINTFNGTIYPTIFDKEQTYSTLSNDDDSPTYEFKLQKNIIYKGKASVKNGKFDFTFVAPKDIAYNFGSGKLSYYATNDSMDANGYTDSVSIGGSYLLADDDVIGPEIQLFINDTDFVYGGVTDENPKLLALVFDEHGINTIGNGIGHDITAILDENSTMPIVLNDFYEAELGNYQKGVINYPFFDLAEGVHTLSLKVWDVYNNSAEAYTEFLVASNDVVVLDKLLNAPNPFIYETSFIFEHNQSCDLLDVQLLIFNTAGQFVRELKATVNSSGYRVGPNQLVWDGTGNGGEPLARGVYIYKLRIQNSDGSWEEKTSKLVLMK